MPSLFPLESVGAPADAILEAYARVGHLVVELPRHVFEAEFDRIHLQRIGDIVHQGFETENTLRIIRPAEIGGDCHVGENGMNGAFHMRALINIDSRDAARALAVRSHAAVTAELDGG